AALGGPDAAMRIMQSASAHSRAHESRAGLDDVRGGARFRGTAGGGAPSEAPPNASWSLETIGLRSRGEISTAFPRCFWNARLDGMRQMEKTSAHKSEANPRTR